MTTPQFKTNCRGFPEVSDTADRLSGRKERNHRIGDIRKLGAQNNRLPAGMNLLTAAS
jgi:hypothetical protein